MRRKTIKVYLALGSNVGDRLQYIESAITLLKGKISGAKVSKIYETEPWGYKDQPTFLNACISGSTELSPTELLKFVKSIEKKLDRKKRFKWGPREIDIDILFYGNKVIKQNNLTIPHPFLHQRSFALVPLSDIAPDFIHPVLGESISSLLSKQGQVELKVFLK